MGKPTMSRDGLPRLGLMVKVRVAAGDLAQGIAHAAVHDDGFDVEDLPERVGRERILSVYRDRVRQFGRDGLAFWGDEADEGDRDTVADWADAVVARAFPELNRRR